MPITPSRKAIRIPINQPKNCKRDDAALPKRLDEVVPACAQPCLEVYINDYWSPSLCSNSTDFGCLCRRYSKTGYTLGEIALACVSSSCPKAAPPQVSQLYNVCEQQSGAVSATHSVLTVLVSASPSTTATSTPSSAQRSNSLTTQSPSLSSTSKASTSSPQPTNVIPIVTSISAPPPAPSQTAGAAQSGSELSSGQAIGITVGAFGGIGLAVGLFFCCMCIRRRKAQKENDKRHKKRESLDFACAETPRFSPFQMRYGDLRGPLGGSHDQRAELGGQSQRGSKRITAWLVPGAVAKARHSRSLSPASINSDRAVSQLLPDKPNTSNQPVTQSTGQKQTFRPFSAQTQDNVFEEDRLPWSPGLQKPAPIQLNFNYGQQEHAGSTVGPLPIFPMVPRRQSTQSSRSTNLSLTIPKQASPESFIPSDGDTAKEVFSPATTSAQPFQTPKSANPNQTLSAGSGMSYLPSYYTSKDSRTPVVPLKSPSRPQIPQQQFRSPPPQKPLPKAPVPRRQLSRASETSFESVDPTEVTPDDELDRRLCPEGASPISGLKYPKIPRSANQAVPRSPTTTPSKRTPPNPPHGLSRSETLASKRRGQEAATDMQRRLGLAEAFSPQAPPSTQKQNRDSFLSYETPARKPVQRPAVQNTFVTPPRTSSQTYQGHRPRLSVFPNTTPTPPRGKEMIQTPSPARGPRLTPTKRGDELFLAVTPV
ncbi:Hypothetical protein D9617_3g020090 [Elsinoe fawcettii]|nr:Hypothetical protein D9617_3g020090 [Elsinoe fawcettii]